MVTVVLDVNHSEQKMAVLVSGMMTRVAEGDEKQLHLAFLCIIEP